LSTEKPQSNSACDHFTLLVSGMTGLSAKIIRRIRHFPNDASFQAVLKWTFEMRDQQCCQPSAHFPRILRGGMIDLALAWRAGATCFVRIWVAGFQHDPQKRTYQHQEVNALQFSSPEAAMVPLPIIVAIIVVPYILSAIKILREYECGVIFRLGRLLPHAKGPGIMFALSFGFVEGAVAIYLGAAVGLLPGYAGTLPDVARLSADLHGQEMRHLNNMPPAC